LRRLQDFPSLPCNYCSTKAGESNSQVGTTGAKDNRKSRLSTYTSIKAARLSSAMSKPGRGYSKNQRNNPMQKQLPMHLSQRCGAHSRRSGKPCRNGAMKNGRCRMHGGKATGAPKGNRNAWKHGTYSGQERARILVLRYLLRMSPR
jgi:hypothetical protein